MLNQNHFPLLTRQSGKKQIDTLKLYLHGYTDVMHLIANITKTCLLALEHETSRPQIPDPSTNVSGLLTLILDLIPYEEADLLDKLREAALEPGSCETFFENVYCVENLFLTMPKQLSDQMAGQS